jgi:hypothetical protein
LISFRRLIVLDRAGPMRPSRWLHALAALSLCLASRAAAQDPAPSADWRTPPSRFLSVTPLTGFPDPIAVSMTVNARRTFTGEAGVSLIAPGAFVRAGVYVPFRAGTGNGNDLLAYAGYRGVVLVPYDQVITGYGAGVGIRSWPRGGGGWGWQVNTGVWLSNEGTLPEARLALVHAR